METLWGKLAKREKELNMSKMGARDLSHAVKAMKTALEQARNDAKAMREKLTVLEVRWLLAALRPLLLLWPVFLLVVDCVGRWLLLFIVVVVLFKSYDRVRIEATKKITTECAFPIHCKSYHTVGILHYKVLWMWCA